MILSPFIKCIVHVRFDSLTSLVDKSKPIFEEFPSMHKCPPSIEHLRLVVEFLVKMLEPPYGFEHQVLFPLIVSIHGPYNLGIFITLGFKHVSQVA